MARLAVAGNAENTNPSITKTKPSATMKSDMGHRRAVAFRWTLSGALRLRRSRLRRRRRAGRGRRSSFAVGCDEETEEFRIRLQQHARVVVLERALVGLHRPVEREEVFVAVESISEDAIAGGIALAARLLGFRGGL